MHGARSCSPDAMHGTFGQDQFVPSTLKLWSACNGRHSRLVKETPFKPVANESTGRLYIQQMHIAMYSIVKFSNIEDLPRAATQLRRGHLVTEDVGSYVYANRNHQAQKERKTLP